MKLRLLLLLAFFIPLAMLKSNPAPNYGYVHGPEAMAETRGIFSQDSTFIYDDGSGENGWFINPDFINWLGNYCPVGNTTGGVIKSVEVFFLKNTNGENLKLSVDIISTGGTVLGSSALFTAVSGSWITVNLPDVPFLGPFYAMVKWNKLSAISHFLGMDNNGPLAAQDQERYFDGTSFQKLSEMGVSDPGNFMIRVKTVIDPAAGTDEPLLPQISVYPNPTSGVVNLHSEDPVRKVRITDVSGKTVKRLEGIDARELTIDLGGLPRGIYFLLADTGRGTTATRISVLH